MKGIFIPSRTTFRQRKTMKKIALFLILFSTFLGAQSVNYAVSFGMIEGLGTAQATLDTQGETYTLKITAKANGIVGTLSNNRQDIYESHGLIKEGVFLPTIHKATTITSDKTVQTLYTFDHANHKVTKTKSRIKEGVSTQESETLPYYATNDILTLYFNILGQLSKFTTGAKNIFHAVGANKTDGRVDVMIPDGAWEKELQEELGYTKGDRYLVVTINQKIFMSENGELHLRISPQGICTHATLKDVAMFGDIKGVITP